MGGEDSGEVRREGGEIVEGSDCVSFGLRGSFMEASDEERDGT